MRARPLRPALPTTCRSGLVTLGDEPPEAGGQGDAPPEAPPAPAPELSKVQKRDPRAAARSVHHLLRHRPKHPYCHACTVGKLAQLPRYKGSLSLIHI
eukprot:164135-Alexandrium_andersonii.AAC.1